MKSVIPLLMLAACSPGGQQPAIDNEAQAVSPPPRTAPVEGTAAAPAIDPKSSAAAVRILRDYFTALSEHRYGDAWRLWSDGGKASGMSESEFARRFSAYRTINGTVGAPGRMEGAAGSSYIDIRATASGRARNGSSFRQAGTFTLRRVNDVPGATPEQLQWRLYKTDLKLGDVAADYRFIGRWAEDERNCASRPWVFTASSLKAPAGSVCSFARVSEVPGGYDIAASCAAAETPRDDVLHLRFAESARAMLVDSRTIGDAGLVACR